jgi:hypothetical protein
MLDNNNACFDPYLYHKMEKDKVKDLQQCEDVWMKNIHGDLMMCGIKKQGDDSYLNHRKMASYHYYCWEEKDNKEKKNDSEI